VSPDRRARLALAVVSALALPSCEGRDDPVGPGLTWTVLYAVELTGTGSVARIVHDDGRGGSVVVADPRPGWTTALLLPPGSTIALRAQGGVVDGRLRVLVDARSPHLPPVVRIVDCTGTATACDVEIPRETLP
jgi:hypothetical protein